MTTALPDLLKGVADDAVARFLALGSAQSLGAGQSLFRLGDAADQIFVVSRGRVALTLPLQIRGGQKEILVEEKLPGETVGWSGLVPPHRFTLNASAPIDGEVLAFPRAALLPFLYGAPEVGQIVAMNLATVIGRRLQVFQAMWLREMQRTVDSHFA